MKKICKHKWFTECESESGDEWKWKGYCDICGTKKEIDGLLYDHAFETDSIKIAYYYPDGNTEYGRPTEVSRNLRSTDIGDDSVNGFVLPETSTELTMLDSEMPENIAKHLERHEHDWEYYCDSSNNMGRCPCSIPYESAGMCPRYAHAYGICRICGLRED